MKKLLNIFLLFILTFIGVSGFAQDVGFRAEMEYTMKNLEKYKAKVDRYAPTAYFKFVNEYNKIVFGVNESYKKAAKKIAKGYTLVKADRVLREGRPIQEAVSAYEDRAYSLMVDIDQTLTAAVHETFNVPSNLKDKVGRAMEVLAPWIMKLEQHFKNKACAQAKAFYEGASWKTFEDLSSSSTEVEVDFSFLKTCGCN